MGSRAQKSWLCVTDTELDLMGSLSFHGYTQRMAFKGEEAELREAESLVQGHTVGKWQTEYDPRGTLPWMEFCKANRSY